ncbi:MAG TPA: Panacea domain-containing protein [Planctomycetota bacterium]|nr:Panacea domain-containing protein [Planctomycetota bacterium]
MFLFDLLKTAQAAGVLLRAHPLRIMSRLRLLKLLYIADRESLRETRRPITGDHAIAMQHGPVLSETGDLIKEEHVRAAEWGEYFQNVGCDVQVRQDPGTGRLSRYEIEKLQEVVRRFEYQDDWTVAETTHQYPEWERNNPGDSSRPIPFEHILEAVGRKKDIRAIKEEARALAAMDGLLGAK